jgi:hypothetical protein
MALNLAPVPKENAVTNNALVSPVWFNWLNTLRVLVLALSGAVRIGAGDPSGVVVGSVGNLWLRSDGGAGSTLYVKESGTDTTAGWVAK